MNCPPAATHRNIAALCQRSRDISLEKGWLNPDGTDPRPPATVFLLFCSEISEALEDYRNNKPLTEIYYEVKIKEDDGSTSKSIATPAQLVELKKLDSKYGRGREFLDAKPCGIPIELADLVIRICQFAGSAGQGKDLDLAYSNTKPEELEDTAFDTILAEVTVMLSEHYQAISSPYITASVEEVSDILASALHFVFRLSDAHKIDLWEAIDEKEAYNRTRPIKHGGKKV